MNEPSQHEANKMVRVLNGTKMKYTVRVHLPDERIVEFQANEYPKLDWNDPARALWLYQGGYSGHPIMACPIDAVILCEENPK